MMPPPHGANACAYLLGLQLPPPQLLVQFLDALQSRSQPRTHTRASAAQPGLFSCVPGLFSCTQGRS